MINTHDRILTPEHLLEDHTQLWKIVEQCRKTLPEGSVRRGLLANLLQTLLERLLDHFWQEENDGYFVDLIDQSPHLKNSIEELLQQHPTMVKQIIDLQNHVARATNQEDAWSVINQKFTGFLLLFQKHEAEETRLLQLAFGDDIGGND